MKAQGQIHDPRWPAPTFGARQRKQTHNQEGR